MVVTTQGGGATGVSGRRTRSAQGAPLHTEGPCPEEPPGDLVSDAGSDQGGPEWYLGRCISNEREQASALCTPKPRLAPTEAQALNQGSGHQNS